MDYLTRANELKDELVAIRRHLHQNPEIEFDLPNTVKFVTEKLAEIGIEAEHIGDCGLVATFGDPNGKTILLRADMDALPIKEKSGEEFASTNDYMHACGHDIHTTCLLGAAKLLKENEANLKGQVKLHFQPAEELLIGGRVMVENGVLENPRPDAAIGLHVWSDGPGSGIGVINGPLMASANNFKITVKGVGAHGSMPYAGVDPVFAGAKIVTGVPVIISRELPFNESAVITMGRFIADGAVNVIPDTVEIRGTVRTHTPSTREYIKERLPQLVQEIAQTYQASAELEFLSDCPPLVNDSDVFEQTVGSLEKIANQAGVEMYEEKPLMGSEDFAYIANEIPSHFFLLHCPDQRLKPEDRKAVHHPEVTFDEGMIPTGAAALAQAASDYLNN